MAHEQLQNGNALKFVKNYWFIIVFIVSMAMAWSNFGAELKAHDIINNRQEVDIEENTSEINILELRYTEDVSIIKTQLNTLLNVKK